jgi:chromosome segregation ATPase
MQSNNTITSLNELIGICENILYKSQQMKQELNLSNQDKTLIQFFSDLCFTIQKISNSLQYFRTSNTNLSFNFSYIMDKNSELEEKNKNLQNQIIYLETSIINLNHKIQDLNSTLIEKEIIIQELSNTKNNLFLCNCNCPCCKEKNNNINNYNT